MITLEFIGAAQTVTGSKHLLRTSRAAVLLDCGLFQGRRRESFERNRNIPVDVDGRSTRWCCPTRTSTIRARCRCCAATATTGPSTRRRRRAISRRRCCSTRR